MQRFVNVSPPAVSNMVVTLEKRQRIKRTPGDTAFAEPCRVARLELIARITQAVSTNLASPPLLRLG